MGGKLKIYWRGACQRFLDLSPIVYFKPTMENRIEKKGRKRKQYTCRKGSNREHLC